MLSNLSRQIKKHIIHVMTQIETSERLYSPYFYTRPKLGLCEMWKGLKWTPWKCAGEEFPGFHRPNPARPSRYFKKSVSSSVCSQ